MQEKTYVSLELKEAINRGYTIDKMHSAVEYERFEGLMKEYVGCFIKMKIENTKRIDQAECDVINEFHHKLGFNFEIKPEDTCENKGLRQIAKICLNSLWGKFGQQTIKKEHKFYFDYNDLIKNFLNDTKTTPCDWHIINETCVELRFKKILIV